MALALEFSSVRVLASSRGFQLSSLGARSVAMVQSDRNEALELNLGADPFLPSMPRPLFLFLPCALL